MGTWISSNPLTLLAFMCGGAATLIVLWCLIRQPVLTKVTKLLLLLGIGVLPIGMAASGNVSGFEATKERTFCGSCHVMKPYQADSEDPKSITLAARHAKNAMFGSENCYACHADYGMYGTIVTKAGGLRHVYEYVFNYHQLSLAEARAKIHIRRPFQNATCMHCHSTQGPTWTGVKEHASLLDRLRTGEVSCASAGCHGPAHPFSKGPPP